MDKDKLNSLQIFILPNMKGVEIEMVNETEDNLEIRISLKHISNSYQYEEIKEQIKKLASNIVEIHEFDKKYKCDMIRFERCFTALIAEKYEERSYLKIIMNKEVVNVLNNQKIIKKKEV